MLLVGGVSVPVTLDELVVRRRSALVVIDVQNDFAHPQGHFARSGLDLSMIDATLPRIRRVLLEARALNIPIIHVNQNTLPDGASDSLAWVWFKTRSGRAPNYTLAGTWGAEPVEGFGPEPGEPTLIKFRPDAFLYTELELLLRARGIETLIICGLFTEGCVESTVRSASYRDFFVVVVEDAVASCVRDLHEGSLRLMKTRYPVCPWSEISCSMTTAHSSLEKKPEIRRLT